MAVPGMPVGKAGWGSHAGSSVLAVCQGDPMIMGKGDMGKFGKAVCFQRCCLLSAFQPPFRTNGRVQKGSQRMRSRTCCTQIWLCGSNGLECKPTVLVCGGPRCSKFLGHILAKSRASMPLRCKLRVASCHGFPMSFRMPMSAPVRQRMDLASSSARACSSKASCRMPACSVFARCIQDATSSGRDIGQLVPCVLQLF